MVGPIATTKCGCTEPSLWDLLQAGCSLNPVCLLAQQLMKSISIRCSVEALGKRSFSGRAGRKTAIEAIAFESGSHLDLCFSCCSWDQFAFLAQLQRWTYQAFPVLQ
jgi:hypothetical protein